MECNHRISNYHTAMEELERAIHKDTEPAPINPVPCNGCTLCCQDDVIRILPQDDASLYQTVPHERFSGQLMLDQKEDGTCIYLTGEGCGIHGTKPLMCQEMDCRTLARKLKKSDLKRYGCPVSVWKRGRQMIGRSW